MISRRMTENDPNVRNQLRNLTAYILNKMMPGSQRNCTSRDAQALNESIDFSQSTNYDVLNSSSVVAGVSLAGQ